MKRLLSLLLAITLIVCMVPMGALTASAAGGVKSRLDSFISSYPAGSRWTGTFDGGKQCYGFAKLAVYNIFGKSNSGGYTYRTWKYNGSPTSGMVKIGSTTDYSSASVKSLLSKARPGDILQFDQNKQHTNNQHTMVIYSVNSSSVTIYDCNWDNNCGIQLRNCSFGTWSGRNSSVLTLLRADNYDVIDGPQSCTCSTSYAGTYTCTVSSSLNIRSGHGTSYSVVGSIPSGATVTVSKGSSAWAHVTYNGVSGYASMQYLAKKQTHTHSYTTRLQEPEHPHKISVRCKDYATCGGWKWTDEYGWSSTCLSCNPKKINVSNNNITLTLGGTSSKSIKVWDTGYYNGKITYRYERSNNNVSCSWGDWNSDGSCPLTFTAKSKGTTKVTVLVKDSDSGKILNSTTVNITVNAKSYTINYNANGGTGAPSSQIKYYGTPLTLSSKEPEKSGYEFLGWSINSAATSAEYKPSGSFNINGNTTLHAVWKKATLTGISVVAPPNKTQYYVGEELDTTGLIVRVYYSDGSTRTFSAARFSILGITVLGFDSTKASEKSYVHVRCENKSTTFSVKILPKIVPGWICADNNWSYRYADGNFAANGWATINGKKYFFSANGYRQTGWVKISKYLYFFNSDGTYSGKFKCAGKHNTTYVAAKAANCTSTGTKAHYKCVWCGSLFNGAGKEITAASIKTAVKHTNKYVSKLNPTCTKTGKMAHYKCTKCGKLFNGAGKAITIADITLKPKHTNKYVPAKAAACKTSGNKAHYKCTKCGKLFNGAGKEITQASIKIAAKCRTKKYVPAVPAKVGKSGTKAHYKCTLCGKRFNSSGKQVTLTSLKIPALKK